MIRYSRFVIVLAAFLITFLGFYGGRHFTSSPYSGIQHHNLEFQSLTEDSPNSDISLKSGDRMLAVDGNRIRNLNHFQYLVGSNKKLKPQIYRIQREDSIFDITVSYIRLPEKKLIVMSAQMIVGLTFIFVGLVVILKRNDILGTLFSVNCLIFSFLLFKRPITSSPILQLAGEVFYDFILLFFPAFFLHFVTLFPGEEISEGSRRAKIVKFLYIPSTLIFVYGFILAFLNFSGGKQFGAIKAFDILVSLYWVFYMFLSLVLFIRTYIKSNRVQKIKLRIAIVGLLIGLLPLLTVTLIKQFNPSLRVPYSYLSLLFLSAISISFAYIILKHDTFNLGIVLRKSLVIIILVVIIIILYNVFVKIVGNRFSTLYGIKHSYITAAALVILIFSLIPARSGIQYMVNRLFFQRKSILADRIIKFSKDIQLHLTVEDLSLFISREMKKIFDVEYSLLYLMEDRGNFTHSMSYPTDKRIPLTSLSPDTKLIQIIKGKKKPLMIEYMDALLLKNNLDRISMEFINMSNASIVVPLIEHDIMYGFVVLPQKKNNLPFNSSDGEILELISERSAAALRNIELYGESLKKEKLEREIQLASDIQSSLLPKTIPSLEGIEIGARLKSSYKVGGDFYDFLEPEPGLLCIGVADVSGKGIPAAILSTSLQAYFRAEVSVDKSPSKTLESLNKSIFKRSDLSRFATFFYAMYEENSGILRYSNGGSFPPIVFHHDGTISRLQRGGILIGLELGSVYKEGIVKLKNGDLLVIYTDGLIDQENKSGEPFGENMMIEFFKNNLNLEVDDLIYKLFNTVLSFGSDKLKDDMTVVIMKKYPS